MKAYVVYMGALPSSEVYTPMSDHMNILQGITGERCELVTPFSSDYS